MYVVYVCTSSHQSAAVAEGAIRSSLTKVDEDSQVAISRHHLFAIHLVSYHIMRAAVFILLYVCNCSHEYRCSTGHPVILKTESDPERRKGTINQNGFETRKHLLLQRTWYIPY